MIVPSFLMLWGVLWRFTYYLHLLELKLTFSFSPGLQTREENLDFLPLHHRALRCLKQIAKRMLDSRFSGAAKWGSFSQRCLTPRVTHVMGQRSAEFCV